MKRCQMKSKSKTQSKMETEYSNREIDSKFNDVHEKLDLILIQTTKHNGRMTRVERVLLVVGCVTGTILVMNGSQLISFFKLFI